MKFKQTILVAAMAASAAQAGVTPGRGWAVGRQPDGGGRRKGRQQGWRHGFPAATQTGLAAGIALDDGSLLLDSQTGQLLRSGDGGVSFQPLRQASAGPASAAALLAPDQLLIGGVRGLRMQPLNIK